MHIDCKSCDKSMNCINGKYCTVKKKYVEHIKKKLCNESK